ncbi:MAG: OmpA family protein [Gammaproteobacteria bacterium]|nr:OmpA family protein [Gammaproteobacteria bacterium]
MTNTIKPLVLSLGLISLTALTGCTAINPYTGQSGASDTTKGAVVGGLGGAGIGALAGGTQGALIGAAIGTAAGGLVGYGMDQENKELRQALVNSGVQVQQNGNQITLIMSSDVTFATNSADINSGFYQTLNAVATVLKKYNNNNVVITGYTDNVGAATYNQQLSQARAQSVGSYLVGQGISTNRLFTQGMGVLNPIASNANAAGRAQNRRVEITLRPNS